VGKFFNRRTFKISGLLYHTSLSKGYFWRTVQQQEIDYVEEGEGKLKGLEIENRDQIFFKVNENN